MITSALSASSTTNMAPISNNIQCTSDADCGKNGCCSGLSANSPSYCLLYSMFLIF